MSGTRDQTRTHHGTESGAVGRNPAAVPAQLLDEQVADVRLGRAIAASMHERADHAVVLVLRLRGVRHADWIPREQTRSELRYEGACPLAIFRVPWVPRII